MSDQARSQEARSIFERWQRYLQDARRALPPDADVDRIIHGAIARWREHEPPELAFVPDELAAERRETLHETAEDTLIERVERGELVALRHTSDGEVIYLEPGGYAELGADRRGQYTAYDPLLARAIRRHAIETSLGSLDTAND
jgi:hypothetical protein